MAWWWTKIIPYLHGATVLLDWRFLKRFKLYIIYNKVLYFV